MERDKIEIRGARVHNLKSVDVDIPLGRIVGVAMGEIVRDTLFTHIEKANVEYPGVYQKLVNCFARTFATGEVKFINREEDVGDPGLRKSKMAYHPLTLLEKFTVRVGHETRDA